MKPTLLIVLAGCLVSLFLAPLPGMAQTSGGAHFGWEVAGGVGGSLAGLGLGIALASDDDCGEELECILDGVALALVTSAAGSVTGSLLAGHLSGDEPSTVGAIVGGVVGAVAGLGVVKLLEESGVEGRAFPIFSFSVSQGFLTGAGAFLLGK